MKAIWNMENMNVIFFFTVNRDMAMAHESFLFNYHPLNSICQ
jgi:hypothetical protein